MTNQEAFDKALAHMRAQGERSVDAFTGDCLYRSDDGLACAVGCLIPDSMWEAAVSEWERLHDNTLNDKLPWDPWLHLNSYGIAELVCDEVAVDIKRHLSGVELPFLMRLQRLHDPCQNWWDGRFHAEGLAQGLAREYGLDYTPPAGATKGGE